MAGIFNIALRLRDQHIFMWQPLKILSLFKTSILIQIFWKPKTFFEKSVSSAESTYIGNARFPYKTALSETNTKKNRVRSTKRIYHKEQSFPSNYLLKKQSSFDVPTTQMSMFTRFRKHQSFIWGCFFSISILKWVQIT